MGDQRPVKMTTTVFVAALSFAGSKKPGAVSGAGPVAFAVQPSSVAGARSQFYLLFAARGLIARQAKSLSR
jgi:hypothetical protein